MNVGNQDQLLAGLRDMAETMRSYYQYLLKQGFTDVEALQIVINWQASIMVNTNK
jgi:hypothetical protein